MLQNHHRAGRNGRSADRPETEHHGRRKVEDDAFIEVPAAELRATIARLLDGRDASALSQEMARVEAQRDGIVALLRAVVSMCDRLERCEALITELHQLAINATPTKEWYTVGELSAILGKAEFTVREWCRLGRVEAAKRDCGRGNSQEWIVSHAELIRIQNEGLLPE